MKREADGPWYTHTQGWIFTLGYSMLVAGVVYSAHYYTWPDLCSDKAAIASWVQAFGSIAAILTSAAVVYWQVGKQHHLQAEHESRGKHDAERDRLLAFIAISQHAHHLIERVWQITNYGPDAENFFRTQLDAEGLDLAGTALHSYSPVGLSTAQAVIGLLGVLREVDTCFNAVYAHRAYVAPHPRMPGPSGLEPLRARLWEALNEIPRLVQSLNAHCDWLQQQSETASVQRRRNST